MKKYKYEARDLATNKIVKSTIQAESESRAGRLLISQGYTPLKIQEVLDKTKIFTKFTRKISNKERIIFIRQLATLIGAGLPLVQSFRTVYEQTQNRQLQAIIGEIMASVESGRTLADSFGAHPELFDDVFVSLITAGEASGTLDTSLNRISNQQEKDSQAISKIRGAMIYPIIVLVVILGVLGFMLVSVMPQIEQLYKDLNNQQMPPISQIMVSITSFITSSWWVLLIVIIGIVIFIRQVLKTKQGISIKDNLKLKIPLFSKLFKNLYMARFTRTSQTLLSSGVTILETLNITSKSVNNIHIQNAVLRAYDLVKGGKTLSKALQEEPVFTRLVSQMIGIGEQSGKIDEMLGKVADVYENELDQQIRNISSTIEPVLMVVLGLFAAVIVGGVLLPVYSLVGGIKF